MRQYATGFLSIALVATGALGQTTVDRKYTFAHIDTSQELREIANSMGTLSGVVTTQDGKTIAVTGTPEQVGVTDWIFQQMDQPRREGTVGEHQYGVNKSDILWAVDLPSTKTVAEFQEIADGARTLASIRQRGTESERRLLIVRGTPEQIAEASWLVKDLTEAARAPGIHQYHGDAEDFMQVFYLAIDQPLQNLWEIADSVRMVVGIRTTATANSSRALMVHGSRDQIAMAAWLVNDLEQAQRGADRHEYRVGQEDLLRVFYLPASGTDHDFNVAANRMQSDAQILRAGKTAAQRAFIVRGTTSEIAQTELLVQRLLQ